VRNLNKPPRYNVASIQAQKTLGGDVMQAHEQGDYVEFRDYQWLLTEKQRLDAEVERLSKKEDYHHDLLNQYALDDMRLTAQVERLTKAGDAMMGWIDYQHDGSGYQHSRVWEAAKGVQS